MLLHRPTGGQAEVEDEHRIKKGEWSQRNNLDDHGAEFFRTKAQRFKCSLFFGKSEGPFKMKTLKGKDETFSKLAKEAQKTVDLNNAAKSVSTAEALNFVTPQKDAKKEGLAKARAKLLERAEADDKRRRLTL